MFKNKFNKADKAAKQQLLQQQPVFKQDYFKDYHRTYSCIHCRAHLANHDELISKLFQGNHGRAYLFNKVVNIGCKQAVQRELLTGLHAVADIYCDSCETTIGWKYEQAFVASQKYKEGKYIIELVHMLKENDWDLTSYNTRELLEEAKVTSRKKQFEANNFKVGNNNINSNSYIGFSSIYDMSINDSGCDDKHTNNHCNETRRVVSLELKPTNNHRDHDIESAATTTAINNIVSAVDTTELTSPDEEDIAKVKKQIPPFVISENDNENGVAQMAEITNTISKKNSNGAELKVDKQSIAQDNRYDDNKRKNSSQNLSVSPKDSLCSYRSQSDLSSSISVTDSSSSTTDDVVYELSPSPSMMNEILNETLKQSLDVKLAANHTNNQSNE